MSDAGRITYTVEVNSGKAVAELNKAGEAAESSSKKFAAMQKAVGNVASIVASFALESMQGFQNMQKEIANATGATGEALAELTADANSALAYLTQSQEEVGRAVGELNTRLGLTGDALQKATVSIGKFAKITGQDMQKAVQSTTKAMAAWGKQASDLPEVLDKLAVAGQVSGKSVDELTVQLQGNASMLRQFGLSMDESISMLISLEKSGVDAEVALQGMQMVLRKAGSEGRNAREVWDEMTQAIQGASDSAEANSVAVQYLGRSAGAMVSVIQDGKVTFDEFTDTLSKSSGAVEDTARASMTFQDVLALFKNIANSLVGSFAPALQSVSELFVALAPLLRLVGDGLSFLIKPLSSVVGWLTKAVESMVGLNDSQEQAAESMERLHEDAESLTLTVEQQLEAENRLIDGYDDLAREYYGLMTALDEAESAFMELTAQESVSRGEAARLQNEMLEARKKVDAFEQSIRDLGAGFRHVSSGDGATFIDSFEVLRKRGEELITTTDELTDSEDEHAKAIQRLLAERERLLSITAETEDEELELADDLAMVNRELADLGYVEDEVIEKQDELADSADEWGKSLGKTTKSATEMITSYMGTLQMVSSQLNDVLSGYFANQTQAIDAELAAQLASYQAAYEQEVAEAERSEAKKLANLKASLQKGEIMQANYEEAVVALSQASEAKREMLEQRYADETKRLQEEAKNKKNEIARKEFETQKGLQIANAVMNAASAIIQCFAQLGPIAGAIAAATVAGLTAAQIAIISGQQFVPSYDTGSGVLGSDRIAQLHKGERVLNRADTSRLEAVGGLSALAEATASGRQIIIDNALQASLQVDGETLAIAVLKHIDTAVAYV